MKRVAFLVGIDLDVQHGRIGTCDADVRRISRILHDQYGFETHCYSSLGDGGDVLKGDEKLVQKPMGFPKSRFEALLEKIRQYPKGSQEDMVLFYYAGHGLNTSLDSKSENGLVGGLVPTDGNPLKPNTLVSLVDIVNAFESWDPGHLLIILDCCYATSLRWGDGKQDFAGLAQLTGAHFQEFVRKKSRQVLTSTIYKPAPAHDFGGSDHSPFAMGMIEGLEHGEAKHMSPKTGSVITVTQLHQFLCKYVKDTCHDHSGLEPGLWSLFNHDRGEFIFTPKSWAISGATSVGQERNRINPYKGLNFYAQEDAEYFLGREEETEALIQLVKGYRLVVLSAESGTGKSSLLRAGVLGKLASKTSTQWELQDVVTFSGTKEQLDSVSQMLIKLESTVSVSGKRNLLILDQFERLSNPELKIEDVFNFLTLILRIVQNESLDCRILIGIRSDFEYLLRTTKPMTDYPIPVWYPLKEMKVSDIEKVIRHPAYRQGVFFQTGMVEKLVAQMSGFPKALGILNLLLFNLYEQVEEDRLIKEEFWGTKRELKGYLNDKMEEIYLELGDSLKRNCLMCLMLRLVEEYDTKFVRRLAFSWELETPDDAENRRIEEIKDVLTKRGILLQSKVVPSGSNHLLPDAKVELSHDIIVESWDRLLHWINTHKEQFWAFQDLMSRARQYYSSKAVNMNSEELKRLKKNLSGGTPR